MHIILMAAGRGLRLGSHTSDKTKCLVDLGGKLLVHRILDSLKPFAVDGITVIGGFSFASLADELKNAPVRLLENKNYTLGNLLTLLCAEAEGASSFCIMNADHFYPSSILKSIFAREPEKITVVCDFNRPLTDDDMKMKRSAGQFEVMKKSLADFDGGYIGVTLVPKSHAARYWAKAHQTLARVGEQVCVEEVVNALAAGGEEIDILDAGDDPWIEIDTPEDLARAHQLVGQMK